MYFVSREVIERVLDACPDDEWRAIVSLSRFGGLRCPSEHLALRWQDIDWDRGRMTVWSCKTEGYEGREFRQLPLFHELRSLLLKLFERAEPGAEYVISRYRQPNCNLRTQLLRIVARAGVTPWPRLFHNLRSSRQTELSEDHPTHVVCGWLGNSPAIAQAHYLQTHDAHFEKALASPPSPTAQNPAQHGAESARIHRQTPGPQRSQLALLPRVAISCDSLPPTQVTPRGFEPLLPG
ncbi:MAG: site-specific integrase [Phycisphaerales bacterium]|nr:site-specific integrase [Phycisphaerales bacterium]